MSGSSRRVPATGHSICLPGIPLLGEDRKRARYQLAGIADRIGFAIGGPAVLGLA